MYIMSSSTRANVERVTGVTIEEIQNMTMKQERGLDKDKLEVSL